MKKIFQILVPLFLFLPAIVLAQNQGDNLSLGTGAQPIFGRTNEARANLAGADAKANYIGLTARGDIYVTSADALTGLSSSVVPVVEGSNIRGAVSGLVGWERVATKTVTSVGSTSTSINSTAHGASVGDQIYFINGAAGNSYSFVSAVPDADHITVSPPLKGAPGNGNTFLDYAPIPISALGGFATADVGAALSVSISSLGVATSTGSSILHLEDAVAASGDGGVEAFIKLQSALSVDAAANDLGTLKGDLDGRAIVSYAPRAEQFSSCSASNTGTSDTAIKGLVASNRICMTSVSCFNTAAVASAIAFKSDTTQIYVGGIGNSTLAGVGVYEHTMPTPVCTAVGVPLNFAMATNATATTCCAAGFIGVN